MVKLKDIPVVIYKVTTMKSFPDRVFLQLRNGHFLSVSVQTFVSMVVNHDKPVNL